MPGYKDYSIGDELYYVIVDGKDKSFNDTYSKAWFSHSFYS